MVMQAIKVERDPDDLTRNQLDDIRDFIRSGFTVTRVAGLFRVDPVGLQKRLENSPRQKSLFSIGGES